MKRKLLRPTLWRQSQEHADSSRPAHLFSEFWVSQDYIAKSSIRKHIVSVLARVHTF